MFFFNQKIFKVVRFAVIVLIGWMLSAKGWCLETHEIGIVAVNRLNMRAGAGTGYPVTKVLKKDTRVRVLAHVRGWLKVFHAPDLGYIIENNDYIELFTIHSIHEGEKENLEFVRGRVDAIKQKMNRQKRALSRYNQQEKKILDRFHQADLELRQIRSDADKCEAALALVTARISDTQQQMTQVQNAIDRGSDYALRRLTAWYKLHKLGEVNLLASGGALHDLMRRRAALSKILRYDDQIITDLAEKKKRLSEMMGQLKLQKNKKAILHESHQSLIAKLAREQQKRHQLLAEIKKKKSTRLASLKYLKNASVSLEQTLHALRREGLSEPDRMNGFSSYQGLLKMPVSGNVISKYGTYIEPNSGVVSFRKGIEIQSRRGTPIRAVFSGRTIYSNWLKGYGNVIIIAHGQDFHSVYAHAEELFRSTGEAVATGEVIATVGDTGAMNGPSLYFEIRHHENSIDPLEWINNR